MQIISFKTLAILRHVEPSEKSLAALEMTTLKTLTILQSWFQNAIR